MRHVGTELISLADLDLFPGNPKIGDTQAIRESVRRFGGQYRSVCVREKDEAAGRPRRVILAGNHTCQALGAEGYAAARCDVIECSDDEARRINAADNKLADLGTYDDELLIALLTSFEGDFEGTGYRAEDLDDLLARGPGGPPDDFPGLGDDLPTDYCCPACGYAWSGNPKPATGETAVPADARAKAGGAGG